MGDCDVGDFYLCHYTDLMFSISPASINSSAASDAATFGLVNGLQPLGPAFELKLNVNSIQPTDGSRPTSPDQASVILTIPGGLDINNPRSEKLFSGKSKSISARQSETQRTHILYFQQGPHDWRAVPNQYFVDGRVKAVLTSFGHYQLFTPIPNLPFAFGEVYVFPNPTPKGTVPTLHIEVGKANKVSTRIYDVSGDLVFQSSITSEITVVDGQPCYEVSLDPHLFKAGVYIGVVTAEKEGKETIRKQYRFTILK
ncbi:MAG: hypothetical protein KCHDKBKB_02575 [Elusimicrobia bacterium]|nr:hypothetical protein [Elusimicrobiota bacterium]